MNIYEFSDYKEYLQAQVDENRHVRGYKSRLAEAAGCKNSFISQVLHGHVHLTLEHAVGLALFWQLSPCEREFFVELVNLARAGTPGLRNHVQARLQTLRSAAKASVGPESGDSGRGRQGRDAYFSEWQHSAVHMLIAVPGFRRPEVISSRLGISLEQVSASLRLLEDLGLCRLEDSGWVQPLSRPEMESVRLRVLSAMDEARRMPAGVPPVAAAPGRLASVWEPLPEVARGR